MSVIAFVRSAAYLPRTCNDLSDLFAIRRQQFPRATPENLLGFWLEPHMAVEIPQMLTPPEPAIAGPSIRILESTGPSAIWTLCWLKALDGSDHGGISRHDILNALLAASADKDGMSSGCFVPVFADDTPASQVQAEIRNLNQLHPHHVKAPLYQDPATGRLSSPRFYVTFPGEEG